MTVQCGWNSGVGAIRVSTVGRAWSDGNGNITAGLIWGLRIDTEYGANTIIMISLSMEC